MFLAQLKDGRIGFIILQKPLILPNGIKIEGLEQLV